MPTLQYNVEKISSRSSHDVVSTWFNSTSCELYSQLVLFCCFFLLFFFFTLPFKGFLDKNNFVLFLFILDKGCMSTCVENMQRAQDLSPLEIIEIFVSIFCVLKDSSEVAQTLLEDFRSSQGYLFLSDFLLR